MIDNYNPGREQVQVTASPNIQSEKARFDPNGAANRLVSALGADSTQRELAAIKQQQEQKALQEQTLKLDWYVEQFQKDHAGGAVSQAQVRERFPETVPTIAARVAEGIGQQQGKTQFAAVVEEIAGNDALRLDSAKRAAFVAQKRQEIVSQVGEGSDFFGAGLVAGIDRLMAQHEQQWLTETATYHEKVQGEQFTGEVADALGTADPGAALLALDEKFAQSSSLNSLERNQLVVGAAVDLAWSKRDKGILDAVPSRFLNADTKAELAKTKQQLADRDMSDFRMAVVGGGVDPSLFGGEDAGLMAAA